MKTELQAKRDEWLLTFMCTYEDNPNHSDAWRRRMARHAANMAVPEIAEIVRRRSQKRTHGGRAETHEDKLADRLAGALKSFYHEQNLKRLERAHEDLNGDIPNVDQPDRQSVTITAKIKTWLMVNDCLPGDPKFLSYLLDCSVSAITNPIGQLRQEGYAIELRRNEGLCGYVVEKRPEQKSEKHLAAETLFGKKWTPEEFEQIEKALGL